MRQTFKVKGMHCKSCETILYDSIGDLKGVEYVEVSEKKGTVIVEYNKNQLAESTIKKVIKNEGYEVQ